MTPTLRAQLLTRRTYCRPKADGSYETWLDVCERVRAHQQWLWERALGRDLNAAERAELLELKALMLNREVLPSGRILWMGGTEQAKRTEISMFNCAFAEVRDVYTAVDAFYLLLNGCGVGFKPVSGLLSGFAKPVEVEVVRSYNNHEKGDSDNYDRFQVDVGGNMTWHLRVGDSGVAWAKAFGKLLAMKKPVDKIVLDFTEIRKPGVVLSGYGWLSSGDEQISKAFVEICEILNNRADQLLTEMDILDLINLVGTTLTSRRSAEIAMLDAEHPLAADFAVAKKDHWKFAPWRSQSNNTLVFHSRPSRLEIRGLLETMLAAGGSEPGIYNGENARRRAPWFSGTNPCGEILLPDGGLCNLVEIDLGKFVGRLHDLLNATELIARANYRQTCVNLKDGTLSEKWHETNEFLRLCGVGITGIVKYQAGVHPDLFEGDLEYIRNTAQWAADQMAKELGLPKSKAVTTVKPSGTLGKIMDTTEGLHKPLARYIFNNVKFSKHDRMVHVLREAGYRVTDDPYGSSDVIVTIPYDNGELGWDYVDGVPVNLESALVQLERYRTVMGAYVDHNASVTISYSPDELPEIADWLFDNWDSYVGVSFILRTDPTKSAEELGYPYLPQQPVSRDTYEAYVSQLKPVTVEGGDMLETDECAGGACPVR